MSRSDARSARRWRLDQQSRPIFGSRGPEEIQRSALRKSLRNAHADSGRTIEIRVVDTGSVPWLSLNKRAVVSLSISSPDQVLGRLVLLEADAGLLTLHRVCDTYLDGATPVVLQIADYYIAGHPSCGFWVPFDDILGVVTHVVDADDRSIDLTQALNAAVGSTVAVTSRWAWVSERSGHRWATRIAVLAQRVAVAVGGVAMRYQTRNTISTGEETNHGNALRPKPRSRVDGNEG